jgi:hypothetical protein
MQITNTNFVNITFSDALVTTPLVTPTSLNYLVVAGGGSGAYYYAGGGGAGGFVLGTGLPVTTGNLVVTVGSGGAASGTANGVNGSNSNITGIITIQSIGGGGGGSYNGTTTGARGGSGGGGSNAAISGGNALVYISDSSTNNFNIIQNGPPLTVGPSPFSALTSASARFNGTTQYLQVAYNTQFDFGTNDFTIEFWMNPASQPANAGLYIQSIDSANYGPIWLAYKSGIIRLYSTTRIAAYDIANNVDVSGTIPINTWTHFAITRKNGVWRSFVNGSQYWTIADAQALYVVTTPIGIGAYNAVEFLYDGYLSNYRVVNGSAIYDSTFTVPTAPVSAVANTVLLIPFVTQGYDGGSGTNGLLASGTAGGGGGGAGGAGGASSSGFAGQGGIGANTTIITPAQANTVRVGEVLTDGTGEFIWAYNALQATSGGARSTPINEGKYYFEIVISAMPVAGTEFGICRDANVGGFSNVPSINTVDGTGLGGMTGGTALGAFVAGDVMKIAYDTTRNQVWIGRNAAWYRNPESVAGSTIPGTGNLRFILMSGNSGGAALNGKFRRSTQNSYGANGYSLLTVADSIPVASKDYFHQGWTANATVSTNFNPITGGDNLYFAGGGGGASSSGRGVAGFGGAGQGGGTTANTLATSGNVNSGGGGGAGTAQQLGQAGGSGVVILSHPISNTIASFSLGSPNILVSAGNVVYVFKQSGYLSWAPPTIEYLIIGGGGGSGGCWSSIPGGGGGGAGGVVGGVANVILGSNITVSIGAGGSAGPAGTGEAAGNGGNTSISGMMNFIAIGGGGGASVNSSLPGQGGSGGGAGAYQSATPWSPGNTSIQIASVGYGLGNNGGNSYIVGYGIGAAGGGGGGSGEPGGNAYYATGGNGGNGTSLYNAILYGASAGTNVNGIYYIAAGGGGGGAVAGGGFPGLGGNGFGAYNSNTAVGVSAAINTGSGAGGAGNSFSGSSATGGTGGSGLFIIRYPDKYADPVSNTGSPNVYVTGGYKYYKFLQSGSIKF